LARHNSSIAADIEHRRIPDLPRPGKLEMATASSNATNSELSIVQQLATSLTAALGSSHKAVEPSIFDGNVLKFND